MFDIYNGLEFYHEEDKMDLEIIMNKWKDFFVGKTHEAFESYKFHLRKQKPSENIDIRSCFTSISKKLYIFASYETDWLGIRSSLELDDCLREKLTSYKQLTLDKCLRNL